MEAGERVAWRPGSVGAWRPGEPAPGTVRPVYDVAALRARIPALNPPHPPIAFFDGPGGSQTPAEVAEAIAAALKAPLSNLGAVDRASRRAEEMVAAGRAAIADLLGADPRGVVFGRSMTQLCYDLSRA